MLIFLFFLPIADNRQKVLILLYYEKLEPFVLSSRDELSSLSFVVFASKLHKIAQVESLDGCLVLF